MLSSHRVGRALVVTLSRPPVNAINDAWIDRFGAILDALEAESGIAVLHIRSDQKVFSAGADLAVIRACFASAAGPDAMVAMVRRLQALYARSERLRQVTVAEIGGTAAGGGFELALACDFIFAGATAILGVPEITLGVFPPAAAALLPIKIGVPRATHAVLTGAPVPVDKWMSSGLIELVAPPEELDAAVGHWFDANLAPRSASALRCAAWAARATTRRQVDAVLPELEHYYLDTLMRTRDAVEGIAAFLEKRQPVWNDQ
jgi:enoyl-CoA hydratase